VPSNRGMERKAELVTPVSGANVYLPDGVSWYEWALCAEKSGFRPVVAAEPDFDERVHLVMSESAAGLVCTWSEEPFLQPEAVEVGSDVR